MRDRREGKGSMTDTDTDAALRAAMTTEHFVLQSAASATSSDAASRSSLYMLALSSSLIAIGFTTRSPDVFLTFSAVVLPVIFLLGLLTTVRLVDIVLEHQQYLSSIARVRAYYRTLGPAAETYFSKETGRWPESSYSPSTRLGPLMASLSTTATMVALVNNMVGAAGVALLTRARVGPGHTVLTLSAGAATFLILTVAFVVFTNWRFREIERFGYPTIERSGNRAG
jgi:hypothetical protein